MKKVKIAGTPAAGTNYELDDGRVIRILLFLRTPVDQLATATDLTVETRGYEINKEGAFIIDDNGEPIMFKSQISRIPMANVKDKGSTLKEGWVIQPRPDDDETWEQMTEGVKKLKNLPKDAEAGDRVIVNHDLYMFQEGIYEAIRKGRLQEAIAMGGPPPTTLTDEEISALMP